MLRGTTKEGMSSNMVSTTKRTGLHDDDVIMMNDIRIENEMLFERFTNISNNRTGTAIESNSIIRYDDLYQFLSSQDSTSIRKFLDGLDDCRTVAVKALNHQEQQQRQQQQRRGVQTADKESLTKCSNNMPCNTTTGSDVEVQEDYISPFSPVHQGEIHVAVPATVLNGQSSVIDGDLNTAINAPASSSTSSPPPPLPPHLLPPPIEVFHQICQSNFLTVQEIGRLVLLTSKSMLNSFGKERAWELICCKQWKNTIHIPTLTTHKRGFEWLFRQRYNNNEGLLSSLSNINNNNNRNEIRNAELSSNNLVMLISIYNSKKREVISLSLQEEALQKLLEAGELNVTLPSVVPLGSYKVTDDGIIDFDIFCTEFINWSATIDLIRMDKHQCSCIHRSTECAWGEYDYCEDPNYQAEEPVTIKPVAIDWNDLPESKASRNDVPSKPPPVEVDMGYLEFSSSSTNDDGDGLEFTIVGDAYINRIQRYEEEINNNGQDTFQSIRIQPTLLCFTKDFEPSMESVALNFSELRLDIWKRYRSGAAGIFDSQIESKRHGISLLHLLDHLIDWED